MLAVDTIKIGNYTVSRLGLGTNRITDSKDSYTLLQHALKLGVNFIDTAHRYGSGDSEIGIGNALSPYPENVVIASKCGFDYGGESGSPEALRKDLGDSLKRLKTDNIKLYQLHRVDPKVPIQESVGALKKFQEEGKIQHIGLSEVSIEQLKQAQEVADIVSVQNEYNVMVRQHEDLVDYCTANNIVFIPWFPLGGLDGGAKSVEVQLKSIASKYDASPQQIAIAWLLRRSPMMLPIPGTLSIAHLKENIKAAVLKLSEEDYQYLNSLGVK